MNRILKFFTGRVFIISALIFIQICILLLGILFLSNYYIFFYLAMLVLSAVIACVIINRNCNPMFKLAWIIPILLFPICGGFFYLIFGRTHLGKFSRKKLEKSVSQVKEAILTDEENMERLEKEAPDYLRHARYICDNAYSSVYTNTETEFLAPGSSFFPKLLEAIDKAEHYIFLEYFIITPGDMWSAVLTKLISKAKSGVEVRIIYDDIGTINTLPRDYANTLSKLNIKTAVFNPYKPTMNKVMNYRDHRKLAIFDGKVAFTGGVNLADEYINRIERFGFWEDCCIRLEGDAVNKVTSMFIQMWNFATDENLLCSDYFIDYKAESDGYIIPFSDEPLDQELVCENAYINIINSAKKYVYISTPYLILDEVMTSALIRAARSGVDVEIITPHIPDKKLVFLMTRSNYKDLIEGGVKIYEFSPGFIHSKVIVSDDETAIVGTSNFDYRSFYLHFENGVWMYNSNAVMKAKEAHCKAREASCRITMQFVNSISFFNKILSSLLKIFAPLL